MKNLNPRPILAMAMLLALLVTTVPVAQAQMPDEYEPEVVVEGMSRRFIRGVVNVATGWLEMPRQIALTSLEHGAVDGIFVGTLKGVGMTVVRTVSGALETVFFFHPYPDFYEPLFEPEYVWDQEQLVKAKAPSLDQAH